jgi:hypothetical protein
MKKWVVFGCGGCLTVVMLCVVALVVLFVVVRNYGQRVSKASAEVQREFAQLARDFPFPTPGKEVAVEANRFDQYLSVRDTVTSAAAAEMDWVLKLTSDRAQTEKMGVFKWVKKLAGVPLQLFAVQKVQAGALRRNRMSHGEYRWLTRMMDAEIHSWRQAPETGDEWTSRAEAYFQPLLAIKRWQQNFEKNRSGRGGHANVEVGPLDYDHFIAAIEQFKNPEHLNRDLIRSKFAALTAMPDGIFGDALIVVGMGEPSPMGTSESVSTTTLPSPGKLDSATTPAESIP